MAPSPNARAPCNLAQARTAGFRATTTVHRIEITVEEDLPTQKAEGERQGLFILVSSRPIDASYPATKVLEDYQGQHVVEARIPLARPPARPVQRAHENHGALVNSLRNGR